MSEDASAGGPERFKRAVEVLKAHLSSSPALAGKVQDIFYFEPELSPAIGVRLSSAAGPNLDREQAAVQEAVAKLLTEQGFADTVDRNYLGNTIVVIPKGGGTPL